MRSRDIRNFMWGEALQLLEQAERLQNAFSRPAETEQSWEPPIDVVETSEALFVHVALPGVSGEAIIVGLEADALTISAVRSFPITARGARLHRVEIPYGRFFRRVRLPIPSLEPAGRSFIDGCLTLVFRKIAVQE
jgi:HSP20 family molecular chaperone IbpA